MSEIIQHYEHGEGYWYSQEVKLLLDADGEPIALGDTLYSLLNDSEFCVTGIGTEHVWGCLSCIPEDLHYRFNPKNVSHKRPDSWKSIKDALHKLVKAGETEDFERECADLIDRCKAMAGENE